MSAMYSHDDLTRIANDHGPLFSGNARQALQWAARTMVAANNAIAAESLRAESAETERDRLRAALQDADTIMGHDDEATEWRERWAHLWGAK